MKAIGTLWCVCAFVLINTIAQAENKKEPDSTQIHEWKDKTILVFTPHPDDETFTSAGTLKMLADQADRRAFDFYKLKSTQATTKREPAFSAGLLA